MSEAEPAEFKSIMAGTIIRIDEEFDTDNDLRIEAGSQVGYFARAEVRRLRDFLTRVLSENIPAIEAAVAAPAKTTEWITGIEVDQINHASSFVRNLNEIEGRYCLKLDLGETPLMLIRVQANQKSRPTGIGIARTGNSITLGVHTNQENTE